MAGGLGYLMRFFAGLLFLLIVSNAAFAERRVALVMGADNYETIRPLENAVADAIAMKDALEGLGFECSSKPTATCGVCAERWRISLTTPRRRT